MTKNVTFKELSCRCGCSAPANVVTNLRILAFMLQRIREHFGRPIIISSGYRCVAHNTKVGGASRSFHISGMAADFTITGVLPSVVQKEVAKMMQDGRLLNGGLGIYNTFTHYDIRLIHTIF